MESLLRARVYNATCKTENVRNGQSVKYKKFSYRIETERRENLPMIAEIRRIT